MGKSKSSQSQSGQSSSTTTATPSAWEQSFNPSLLDFWQSSQPMISGVTGAGGALAQNLLGGMQLPGAYGGGSGLGATPYGIDGNAQNAIVNESLRSLPPSLQATGMLDSGAAKAMYARGAQNVLSNVAQFNTGAQQSAMGMGSQIGTASMQPAFNAASMLTSLLPGLRTITQNNQFSQQANTTSQQPLAQTIGQLSSAFGTGAGGGNLLGSFGPMAQGGLQSLMGQFGNLMGGQSPAQASMFGTIPGGGGGSQSSQGGGSSAGSLAGTGIGALLGTLLFPGVGTGIGASLGGSIGSQF